jgi:putative addiction module CopG family antidote
MPTQNVNLTSVLDSFVKKQVQSGYFNNASEVHRAALSAMCKLDEERRYRVERLKVEVQKGIDTLAEGDVLNSTARNLLFE